MKAHRRTGLRSLVETSGAHRAQRLGNIEEPLSWNDQVFAGNEVRRYTWSFTVPADLTAGTYRVHAGIFAADWSINLMWLEGVGAFDVQIPPAPRGPGGP